MLDSIFVLPVDSNQCLPIRLRCLLDARDYHRALKIYTGVLARNCNHHPVYVILRSRLSENRTYVTPGNTPLGICLNKMQERNDDIGIKPQICDTLKSPENALTYARTDFQDRKGKP